MNEFEAEPYVLPPMTYGAKRLTVEPRIFHALSVLSR